MWFFRKRQSHYQDLTERWTERHRKIQEDFWYKHGGKVTDFLQDTKSFTIGSLAGLILLLSPAASSPLATGVASAEKKDFQDLSGASGLILDLLQFVPNIARPLSPYEEKRITQLLTKKLGFSVTAEINGIRLERNYGYIGQEQHLARFPGDNMSIHLQNESENDQKQYYSYGMAPGLGAYGYFAPSQSQMTEEENLREKWYIAVQTFLAPGYNENVKKYNDFFRYHKVIVLNPQNGKAIVADIGDAGPSPWTGKSLGGSPEVMHYLERVDGAQRGTVLYFFIDDPKNTVPLGPVQYN